LSERLLKGLLALLAVLLVVYGAIATLSGNRKSERPNALAKTLQAIRADQMETFRILRRLDTLDFRTAVGGWMVNGYPVDTAAISHFWRVVSESRVTEVAASNPANHRRLGVAADSSTTLELRRKDGRLTRVLVGKSGPVERTVYLRLPGDDRVYTVHGDLLAMAGMSLTDWRDKTIVRVDTAAVRAVTVLRDGVEYGLRRAGAGWEMGGAAADTVATGKLLIGLANLQAVGFSRDSTAYGKDRRRLTVLGARDDTLALMVFRVGGRSQFLATIPRDSVVYEVPFQLASWITPTRVELLPHVARAP